jgi:NAD(P)-dependent dehydrogenase (short-subunit alcohol dehydrogenase family)
MVRTRSILITGCSTGIGADAARTLAQRGWRVFATARRDADLAALAAVPNVTPVQLELSDRAARAAAVEVVLAATGGTLDALYNNAAYGLVGAMEDIPLADLERHFEVNVFAVHDLVRRIVPVMRRQGRGRIVNCSSVLGLVSGPYRGAYCATKFALEAMSDALREELRGTGIHVSVLEPGPIATRFMATTLATFKAIDTVGSPHARAYQTRLASMTDGTASRFKLGPDAVVRALVDAVESDRPQARYKISPHTHAVGIAKRLLPRSVVDALMART